MVSMGSTKTVCPLELAPWTTPWNAALLLDLDGNDEALAANGDEFVLHGAAFGEAAEVSAQRFLDRAALFFDLAADASQFGRGPVFERAIGLDLVAERTQELAEVGDPCGESAHRNPFRAHSGGRVRDDFAPFGGAIDDQDHVADLGGLQSGAGDARLLHQTSRCRGGRRTRSVHRRGGIREFRTVTCCCCSIQPVRWKARAVATRSCRTGTSVSAQQFAQGLELENARGGVGEQSGHASVMLQERHRVRDIMHSEGGRSLAHRHEIRALAMLDYRLCRLLAARRRRFGRQESGMVNDGAAFGLVAAGDLASMVLHYTVTALSPRPVPLPTGLVV